MSIASGGGAGGEALGLGLNGVDGNRTAESRGPCPGTGTAFRTRPAPRSLRGHLGSETLISEADRHNIRGEHISVDTIPLVGEAPLAEAVRAVIRLPRARALVLAGSLMGGDIEQAVREVRAQGLLVISLNMAGGVPEAADL